MSQLGMTMPGAQRVQRPRPNVYTGLLLAAVIALAAACAIVYLQGAKIAPQDDPLGPLKTHPEGQRIDLGR